MWALAASEVTLTTEWLGFLVLAFSVITASLAFYIRATVKNATITLNQVNGGSHLADLPAKVMQIEAKLDEAHVSAVEAKVTGRILLKNQLELMAAVLPHRHAEAIEQFRENHGLD